MAEWLKAHAWKACIRETVSWVRIPLPPPDRFEIIYRRDRLAVDNAGPDIEGSGGDCDPRKAVRPVDAVSGQDPNPVAGAQDHRSVAVVFDLMKPAGAGRR